MRVISDKRLREFWASHLDAEKPLRSWYQAVKRADWKNFADVRTIYPSADQVGKFTVFNIGGNKYRLITTIHYNTARVYIRNVLAHKEYDLGKWKDD